MSSRDGAAIDTLNNVKPGEKLTYTDENAIKNKVNTYEVVAYSADGDGMPASQSTYVGIDVPLPPTQLVASYGDNGKINLTWKAPVTGVTGGYIDPTNLYYGIQRSVGGKATVLTANQKQTTYTDQIDDSGEQTYLLYGVSAANRSGYSELATSNALIKGTPYTLPFMETLKNGSADHFWGMQSSVAMPHGAHKKEPSCFLRAISPETTPFFIPGRLVWPASQEPHSGINISSCTVELPSLLIVDSASERHTLHNPRQGA